MPKLRLKKANEKIAESVTNGYKKIENGVTGSYKKIEKSVTGIVIGITGIAGIISAYPVYTRITKKQRKKLAPEIIKLADELME